jgi:hypothetical protein
MTETLKQIGISENNIETERLEKKQVNFIFDINTAEQLINTLDSMTVEGEPDLVMLNEYALNIEDVINNTKLISDSAKKHNTDIILAAAVSWLNQEKEYMPSVSWDIRRKEILESEAKLLDDDITEDEFWDSIGYYFGKDGEIYAFPKTRKNMPCIKFPILKLLFQFAEKLTI